MPTIDQEIYTHATAFMDRAVKDKKPFFVWFNSTRMHVLDPPEKESSGKHRRRACTPDGMVEHDAMVGELLKKVDDLGIAGNTIVMYGTDNGAEIVSWPDGGNTPFHGEKGTTWEGGHRVPLMVRWPGVVKPGTIVNDMIAHNDWMPTLLAAAGEPDVKEKLSKGHMANGKAFKVHLDGYNFLPFFKGEQPRGPREEYLFFGQGGDLNAVRWTDWKIHFATVQGNIATGTRQAPGWPLIINLRADPYERAAVDSAMYLRWYADLLWLFEPVQQKVKAFLVTIPAYPYQEGASLNAAGINYNTLKAAAALKRLQELETLSPPLGR